MPQLPLPWRRRGQVLLGTNRDEGTEFNELAVNVNESALAAYLARVAPDFGGPAGSKAILGQYAASRFHPSYLPSASASWWRFTRLFGDMQVRACMPTPVPWR